MIRSLLTTDNPFNSSKELLDWISRRNQEVSVEVNPIPFSEMAGWHIDEDGCLRHNTGRFFSVQGIHVETDFGYSPEWDQPIIVQPEIGYLGILAKEFNGVLYFLMQAKIEPGNVNCVQISPTLQATKSNYTRVHNGKKPAYLDYFVNVKPENVLLDQLQSEQGARFLRKRNRNIIIKVDEDVEVLPDFRWMTIGQIKEFMHQDNRVNMDTRTVLSGIEYTDYVTPMSDLSRLSPFGWDLFKSARTAEGVHSMNQLLSWLTGLKSRYDLFVSYKPIDKLKGWHRDGMEIANAFGELADPAEQRRRFEAAREEKIACGETPMPIDEDFLAELARMPPAGGAALGVDRLAMVLLDAPDIDSVRAFLPPVGALW